MICFRYFFRGRRGWVRGGRGIYFIYIEGGHIFGNYISQSFE